MQYQHLLRNKDTFAVWQVMQFCITNLFILIYVLHYILILDVIVIFTIKDEYG